MKYNIGRYSIEKLENGNLKIDSKRSPNDYYYIIIITYFLISLPILYFCYKLSISLIEQKFDRNAFFGYLFLVVFLVVGLYFLAVSIETFIKPVSKVFYIDKTKQILNIRLNLIRRIQVKFSEIKKFEIGANDITVFTNNRGRTYKRQLYIVKLNLKYINNKIQKIHNFEKPNLIISFSEKKNNESLKEISKQITNLISNECNKDYYWTGTKK
jgi:hypothetical protein